MNKKLAVDAVIERKDLEHHKNSLRSRLFKAIGNCNSFHAKICRIIEETKEVDKKSKNLVHLLGTSQEFGTSQTKIVEGSEVRLDAETAFIPLENESKLQEERDFQKKAKKSLKKISDLYKFEMDELAQKKTTIEVMKEAAHKQISYQPSLEKKRPPTQEKPHQEVQVINEVSNIIKQFQKEKELEEEF